MNIEIELINSTIMKQYVNNKELDYITKAYIISNSEEISIEKKIILLKKLKRANETIINIIDNYQKIQTMFNNDDNAIYRLSIVEDEDNYRYYTEYGLYNTLKEVKEVVNKIKDINYFTVTKEYINSNKKIIMYINNNFDNIKVDTKNILKNQLLKITTTHPFRVGDVIYQRLSFTNDNKIPVVVSKIDKESVEVIYIEVNMSNTILHNKTITNLLDYELQKDISNEPDIFNYLVAYQKEEINIEKLLEECHKYQEEMRN